MNPSNALLIGNSFPINSNGMDSNRALQVASRMTSNIEGVSKLSKLGRGVSLLWKLVADQFLGEAQQVTASGMLTVFSNLDRTISGRAIFANAPAYAENVINGSIKKQGFFTNGKSTLYLLSGTCDFLKFAKSCGLDLGDVAKTIGGNTLYRLTSNVSIKVAKGVFLIPACIFSIAGTIEKMIIKKDATAVRDWLGIAQDFGKIMLTSFQFMWNNYLFAVGAIATSILGLAKIAIDETRAIEKPYGDRFALKPLRA